MYTVLPLSVLPSVTNIFRPTFLSNHASLETSYGVSAIGQTCRLLNSGPPHLLSDLRFGLLEEMPSRSVTIGLFEEIPSRSVTIIFCCTFLSSHASQPLQTWYGALARILQVAYRIQVQQGVFWGVRGRHPTPVKMHHQGHIWGKFSVNVVLHHFILV